MNCRRSSGISEPSRSSLIRHHVLNESDDDGEDSAANAASNQLADNRADINAGKRRDQRQACEQVRFQS